MICSARSSVQLKAAAARRLSACLLALALAGLPGTTGTYAAEPEDPLAALAPLTTAYVYAAKPADEVETYRELFATVAQRVRRSYPQEVDLPAMVGAALKAIERFAPHSGDPAAVFKAAINAGLAEVDPHSKYLDPREQREQRTSLSGAFGGLGMQVEMVEGLVRVVTAMPDTPAARAGLQTGDLIVRFDNQAVLGMTLNDAISRMRGQPGTPVTLVIRRPGREGEFSVSLVREVIRSQALRWRMEGDALVLRLTSFNASLGAAFEKAIGEATAAHNPHAVILDLRGNPGGLLNQAIVAADIFLSGGEIVSLRGRSNANRRIWYADEAEKLPGLPMVVLIDGRSASAAELVAAALQENGRAVVMGQRSFGKGSVQAIIPLGEEKGALRLTTALYYGPSGRTVQRTGVGPDIELTAVPAARAARRESDRAHALPGADDPPPPKARIEASRCAPVDASSGDHALACALAYVKAGAIDTFVATLGTTAEAGAPPD